MIGRECKGVIVNFGMKSKGEGIGVWLAYGLLGADTIICDI